MPQMEKFSNQKTLYKYMTNAIQFFIQSAETHAG